MITSEELLGKFVLIRSNPEGYFPSQTDQIGILCSELLDDNHIMVKPDNGKPTLFSIKDLFQLRNPEDIRTSANNDVTLMPYDNYWDVMEVAMFAKSPNIQEQRLAIELSRKDPDVLEYTMARLDDELGLNQSCNISR
jgi:hypothetical protein